MQGNIQDLFDRAAEEFKGRTAIDAGGARISFGELSERANHVANFLIASGFVKGATVGILADDAIHVVTAILGILKAGGVFVPFDLSIPPARLQAMAAIVAPEWYVIESKYACDLARLAAPSDSAVKFIAIDQAPVAERPRHLVWLDQFAKRFYPTRPAAVSEPDDMCYVYFTSGSTGSPKGIAGRLKGIDHFIRWEIKTLGLGPGTRVSRLLSFSFDGSLRDIFVPLCTGGTMCASADRDTLLDASKLIAWIDAQQINVIHCVPSLFRALVNERLRPDHFQALRYILLSGEPLLPSDVGRWMSVFGERVGLINMYGTSETTMAKFIYFIKKSDQHRRSIPVGKPMEGARALLIDDRGRPCAPGVVGEIYIRTPYRSLGYYNQPELTETVFVKNPFSDDPTDIIHKTGDYGVMAEDGNFEHLGRKDHQVKVRGVRIELGEIENVLRRHEAVDDVVVVDQDDGNGEKHLCAYLVLRQGIETGDLKAYLRERLLEQMVPGAFVIMQELPRTITGKIDRRALPAVNAVDRMRHNYVAPRTAVEEILAGIWASLLDLERVGIRDNFFDIGGHSLRATQVLSRVRAVFGVEISLRELFERSSVAALAELIEAKLSTEAASHLPPIRAVSRTERLCQSFAQQRLWFLDQLEGGDSVAYNVPAAYRVRGPLDPVALQLTLSAIVERHEVLRTSYQLEAGQPLQLIEPPRPVELPLHDLSATPEPQRLQAARHLAASHALTRFDLQRGPLLRAALIKLAEDDHVILLALHHIVCDGWSVGILIREVSQLYDGYVKGEQRRLPELPIQYADYAVWQRQWLQGEVLAEQLAYWQRQLGDNPPALELPADRPRPAVQSYRGANYHFEVGAEVSQGLRGLSRREGVTLYMVMLAAFQALLYRYSGQHDLLVGTPVANRGREELEGLIGFFVNTLVMRGDLSGDPSFRELLKRTREVALGAYAHQDIPFELLVEHIKPERRANYTPLFQVWFAFSQEATPLPRLSGLAVEQYGTPDDAARFDLALVLNESGEGIRGTFTYSTDLFDGETIFEMAHRFKTLLTNIPHEADKALLDLGLDEEEMAVFSLAAQSESD